MIAAILEAAHRRIREERARLKRRQAVSAELAGGDDLELSTGTHNRIRDLEWHQAEVQRRLREAYAQLDAHEAGRRT